MVRALVLLGGLVLASGCSTSRSDDVAYSPEGFVAPDPVSVEMVAADYRIAPLDKVLVNVFQVEQFSGEYQVDLTGRINLPLIGAVEAVNQTTDELQARLKERLSAEYLKNPDVTVGIVSATGSNITIDGAVRRPGVYPNFGSMTLVQAVAVGGGLDNTANPKRVFVFRQIDGERMIAGFDLTTIRKGQEPDPEIFRGDIIVVEGSRRKETMDNLFRSVQTFGIFRPF
ncbi:polysaccharide biosynthesis/export family protein [Erythrobacter sp. HL-111]|uniref:polysaccharide biosynthesis/export family protein n=1 Tax=Erythrobacter sp. HL-111 TaxID=1798193 RepID=UPI0006D95D46|nr:polysaccharide biosynthesis/export family protein [Erythrobacter sp. HL-111]KPP95376.1 MAG: polysaccharide export outer membrane protein [Erythrobacteraceae bacterium HL-111]SDS67399.1 polysaccharide export outer membrane protein [Erythrobacter sp. HL-111]